MVSRDVVSTSYSEQGTLSLLKGINPTVQGRKVLHPCDDAVKFQVEINGANKILTIPLAVDSLLELLKAHG